MEAHGVVPDVIAQAPPGKLTVTYGLKNVDFGTELSTSEVAPEPQINFPADPNKHYFLLMVDPDAPTRKFAFLGQVNHWMVGNIPGNDVKSGVVLVEYHGAGAPRFTGLHRYVFLVYEQKDKIEFKERVIDKNTRSGRMWFSVRKYAEKYDLGQPVFGNFFQAQWGRS